ncbi:unnamed protein product [Didymodactylos carnosus]|uniref:Uncharacterized protein n=1 Tax=Didymodactylos carnosus TaxID=1234261 RepID=A0A816D1H9_9BILA|nr:unnamed protein product [Didymodactylos carnosus]CAF4532812.1 unnamed protein product [Didymodactylos carnosus]
MAPVPTVPAEHFFSDYGLQLSRNTKAVKVWMTLKTYGIERFGRIMEQNVDQALYFAHLIEQHSNQFELLAKVTLNIVCFRYIVCQSNTIDQHDMLNKFNKRLLIMIQERGIAIVSPFVIGTNTFALRMCITNHRTRLTDMDKFIEQVIQLARELLDTDEFATLKTI